MVWDHSHVSGTRVIILFYLIIFTLNLKIKLTILNITNGEIQLTGIDKNMCLAYNWIFLLHVIISVKLSYLKIHYIFYVSNYILPLSTERKQGCTNLRNYQIELTEIALRGENTIICAESGAGKTYVSFHVIEKHLLNNPRGKICRDWKTTQC